MNNWAEYVRRFYELSAEAQLEEWEKLTAEQRRYFEGTRAAAEEPPPNLPTSSSLPKVDAPKKRFGPRGCLIVLGAFILVVGLLALLGSIAQRKNEERAKERARLQAEQAALAEQLLVESFLEERDLGSEDPDLAVLHERAKSELEAAARVEYILNEIKKTSEANLVKRRDLYRELSELVPGEPEYKEMLGTYSLMIEKQVAEARREREQDRAKRERADRRRKARVAKFGEPPVQSGLGGSYAEVEVFLKTVANDPDSIVIAGCTEVYHTREGWLVGCDYRGRNAYGGLVRQSNWFTIVHGRVIEIHDASAFDP